MTETLNGRQVLALLAQDEPPEIEADVPGGHWCNVPHNWAVKTFLDPTRKFRIKPTPQRRLSVTLANGEVVSWPEPVREGLEDMQQCWFVGSAGKVRQMCWTNTYVSAEMLKFGSVHLTREAAQEHADALRKINTQGVGK